MHIFKIANSQTQVLFVFHVFVLSIFAILFFNRFSFYYLFQFILIIIVISESYLLIKEKAKNRYLDILYQAKCKKIYELKNIFNQQKKQIIKLKVFSNYGKIASALIHDINNHLTTIILGLDYVGPFFQKHYKSEYEDIFEATENIKEVINISKNQLIDPKLTNIEAEKFNISAEIQSIVKILHKHFESKKIVFILECSPEINCVGLKPIFNQVLCSLIMNSIESYCDYDSNDRQIKIVVNQSMSNEKNKYLIQVMDNGCGISKKNLKKIFDKFFTTKCCQGGTGLGLYFAKKYFLEFFNGELTVTSQPNKGSVFNLVFTN